MPLYQAIVLAVIQGLTEFLPVSSTAHLALVPQLLHWADPGLGFDVALHVGTLAAVLIYFFRDWVQVVANGIGITYRGSKPDENSRSLLWYLVVATIPAGLAGLKFQKYAEHAWRSPYVIGAMLIGVGIVMYLVDQTGAEKNGIDQMSWFDVLIIGIAQAFAIVPGVSRSGITIAAARFRHFNREASARFSFLLSTPVIAAAALKDAWDLHKEGGVPPDMKLPYLAGILVSAFVGIIVIAFFLYFLRRHSLSVFVWYRIVFGIIVIALAVFFRIGG
ncbi:MAG TPA: undecaprenyl-diphosphatase UppP [Bryobacteraceae bacterium]|nr:undecaprenyl-diphosphatase UppP [Bryobacteraceae bacterium]